MKIKNVTGGILQDTKMGWILQPDQVIEVDDSKPEVIQRVQQLQKHNLIAVVEGNLPETGVTVKPVEVEEETELSTSATIDAPVEVENTEEQPEAQPNSNEEVSDNKKRSRKK